MRSPLYAVFFCAQMKCANYKSVAGGGFTATRIASAAAPKLARAETAQRPAALGPDPPETCARPVPLCA